MKVTSRQRIWREIAKKMLYSYTQCGKRRKEKGKEECRIPVLRCHSARNWKQSCHGYIVRAGQNSSFMILLLFVTGARFFPLLPISSTSFVMSRGVRLQQVILSHSYGTER